MLEDLAKPVAIQTGAKMLARFSLLFYSENVNAMDLGAIILVFIVDFEVDVYIDVDVDIQGARGQGDGGAERYLARKSRHLAKSKV